MDPLALCRRPLKKFQQPKQSEKGPRWVKDKAVFWCKSCNTDFSVVVRKHHCRHCGHVFCGHCCSNKRTLIKYGYLKPVRLCNKCNASCFKADLLLNAVGLNDINTVTKICEEGCDLHFTTTVFPALTIAANRGSSDMVRVLLRYGADPNHAVPATDSGTVIQCSRCGRTQAAGNMKDNQYECSYCGNFTRHADASDSDHTGITALHAAVQKEGHLDVVVALLEHGADVDCQTAKGNTALMYASAGGHVECAKIVLEYGASPNVKSEADSDTPMHKAVREGHMTVVELLLKHRADLTSTNIAGLSPLQLAERCKRSEIAALLEDVEKNGFPEPASAPSKVPAPLLSGSTQLQGGGALTGGKTFEELMSIKSAPEVDCPPSAPEIGAKDQDDEALEDEVIDFAHVSVDNSRVVESLPALQGEGAITAEGFDRQQIQDPIDQPEADPEAEQVLQQGAEDKPSDEAMSAALAVAPNNPEPPVPTTDMAEELSSAPAEEPRADLGPVQNEAEAGGEEEEEAKGEEDEKAEEDGKKVSEEGTLEGGMESAKDADGAGADAAGEAGDDGEGLVFKGKGKKGKKNRK